MPPPNAGSEGLSRTAIAVYLAIIVAAALAIRTVWSVDVVFQHNRVNFQDNDSWYHMRLIDSVTANWPARPRLDPFVLVGGQGVPVAPLFDLTVSSAALIAGGGAPGPRTIETVAAWTPAILGALIPLVVFAIGRRVFDTKAALMGAALVAVMPGHLLERSRLGYVDHHVLEALLSMLTLLALLRVLPQPTLKTRAVAAALAGGALGLYLLSWASGSFVIAIVTVWLVTQFLVESAHGERWGPATTTAAVAAATSLPIIWMFQERFYQYPFQWMSLVGVIVTAAFLESIRFGFNRAGISARWLPAALAGAATAAWFIGWAVAPGLAGAFMSQIDRMRPDSSSFLVMEAMPLTTFASMPWAKVSPYLVLGTGLPLGAIGCVMLVISVIRRNRPELTMLLVWTAVVLAATLLKNRFGYYLVPLLAVLGGWVCSSLLDLARRRGFARDLAAAAIGALAFAPNLWPARNQVRTDAGLSQEWVAALDWLKQSTPAPFADPNFYYAKYTRENQHTQPRFSVLAWWDYGYWITRGARRVPVTNPTQMAAAWVGSILLETDPAKAREQLDAARARYVLLDGALPFRIVAPPVYVMGKFETIVTWAGRPAKDFYEALYVKGDRGQLLPAIVFYPAYYQAMVNRLYLYGGQAVTPKASSVMTYADRIAPDGSSYREVVGMETFPSYEQAQAYLTSRGPGPHRLVGLQPDETPVPLEAWTDFRPVWASREQGPAAGRPAITIFERHLTLPNNPEQ